MTTTHTGTTVTSKHLTIDDVVQQISAGLPSWQLEANRAWLISVHGMLKDDGVWYSPALDRKFKRDGEGFIEITQGDIH